MAERLGGGEGLPHYPCASASGSSVGALNYLLPGAERLGGELGPLLFFLKAVCQGGVVAYFADYSLVTEWLGGEQDHPPFP